MLEASHLVKRFFGITVVDDVSFVIRRGEVVGYLGPMDRARRQRC